CVHSHRIHQLVDGTVGDAHGTRFIGHRQLSVSLGCAPRAAEARSPGPRSGPGLLRDGAAVWAPRRPGTRAALLGARAQARTPEHLGAGAPGSRGTWALGCIPGGQGAGSGASALLKAAGLCSAATVPSR